MPETHQLRRDRLRAALAEREMDALLVVDLVNIRYLTGFTGSNAVLLAHAAGERRSVFGTDGRYDSQSAAEVPDLQRVIGRRSVPAMAEQAAKAHCLRVGFESQHVTVDGLEVITTAGKGVRWERAPGMVERLREVKDDGEIESLRMACAAADRALASLIADGGLRAGRTELRIARELDERMRQEGADGPGFETIVAAGVHSAIPHHSPTDTPLLAGDFVKMDFGAEVDGYHSDMTRTVVLGPPADWQREVYQLVVAAQAVGRDALAVGAITGDVDAAARAVIDAAGYGERFVHGLGHGVGLRIHEAPSLGREAAGTLAAGMAVTVEPGVYLAERGGVRIEDTLVVREGPAELLTMTSKDLVVV
ncbi:MAG: M24 family metallopeptidase [Sciscionella sp.]